MAQAPVLHIYYAPKPPVDIVGMPPLFPPQRQDEIDACPQARVRTDKYYVWRLLALGLKDTFGWDMQNLAIRKEPGGQWVCDDCFFSLSHGNMPQGEGDAPSVLAVAISTAPVGVDIEYLRPLPAGIERRILSQEALHTFSLLPKEARMPYLVEQWTKKESVFKRSGASRFLPTQTDTTSAESHRVRIGGADCLLSVASSLSAHARLTPIDAAALLQGYIFQI